MSKDEDDIVIGQKIVNVRKMTKPERESEGWEDDPHPAIVLVLENGVLLYPSMDEEGNGGGALFGIFKRTQFSLSCIVTEG